MGVLRFRSILLVCANLALLLALSACDQEFDTVLTVVEGQEGGSPGLRLNRKTARSRSHYSVEFAPGQYRARLKISDDRDQASELRISKTSSPADGAPFLLRLPRAKDFLRVNEPQRLSSDRIGQPFSLVVTREVDLNRKDLIGVSFYSSDFQTLLAVAKFEHESAEVAYDPEKMEFLRSYQEVRRSQRGLFFAVDADADSLLTGIGTPAFLSDVVDGVLNYGAMVYIAPWMWARYQNVRWILGDDVVTSGKETGHWAELLKRYPVIDYFSFVHDGTQRKLARPLWTLERKKHQIRWVYTGACRSGSADEFVRYLNAAMGTGHARISASPLFQFTILRNWAYGESAGESVMRGFEAGRKKVEQISFATFSRLWENKTGVLYWSSFHDMLESSEPMMSWTSELPPQNLFVGLSAVPSRSTERSAEILSETVTRHYGVPLLR